MADFTLSAVLRLRDEMSAKLKGVAGTVAGLSAQINKEISKGAAGISKGAAALGQNINKLGSNLSGGDLARLERLKGVLEAAGMQRPIDLRARDSASAKIKKIKQELQNLVGKPWQAVVNIKNNASAALGRMRTGVSEMIGGAAMGMGAGILGTAGIGYGAVNAVQSQMDFEKQMSAVKAIYSGAYQGEDLNRVMERLTAKAEEMGATTKFTAKQAAEGIRFMAMAGWNDKRAEAGLPSVLNLAAAGNAELGLTSDIVTDSMTGFHLEAGKYIKSANGQLVESTKHYADMMAALVTHANTDIPMLGETLKYVAPNVGALYENLGDEEKLLGAQDTMLIAGLMANSGIKASQAGTSARAILTRLAAQNRNAYFGKEIMGVQLEGENGEARRLKDIFGDFRERFKNGMPADQLIEAAEMLEGTKIHADTRRKLETFLENAQKNGGKITGIEMQKMAAMLAGQEAMTGFLAVATASDKDWKNLSDALDDAAGSAERMARIQLDNLAGDLTYLGSAWDAFQRGLVKGKASEGLRAFAQAITDTLSKANELFKDGIDFSDFGKIIIDVIAKLKAKFLELDGIGSLLAGGALIMGMRKILSMALKVKDTLSTWSKVRTTTDVGNILRGNAAGTGGLQSVGTMTVNAGTMNVRAGVVNLTGAIRGGAGGGAGGRTGTTILGGAGGAAGRGGTGGAGGRAGAGGIGGIGGVATVLTATQIAQQKAERSAAVARNAQARADTLLATAWGKPAESAKVMAQYERASERARQAQARANQEAARYAQLRVNDERTAAYYSKREAVAYRQSYEADIARIQQEMNAQRAARRQVMTGSAAGGAAMGAVFGLMDVAATRTTGQYNLDTAKTQVDLAKNELKNLREQGADISQINAQIETIRQKEENVRQISELNATNERRAGAGAVGMVAGTAIGAAVGSMVPVIGNMVGGMLGGFIGQKLGEYAADNITPVNQERGGAENVGAESHVSVGAESHVSMGDFKNDNDNSALYLERRREAQREQERDLSENALRSNARHISARNTERRISMETDVEKRNALIAEENAKRERDAAEKYLHANFAWKTDQRRLQEAWGYRNFTLRGGEREMLHDTAEGWADTRGGGIQTVDEKSAKVQRLREDFERGIARNQSTLSQISANTTEGRRRAESFLGTGESRERWTKPETSIVPLNATGTGAVNPLDGRQGFAQSPMVTPVPSGNVPSIAEFQRINNETQNVTRTEIPANLRVETGGVRMETGGQTPNQQAVQILPNMPAIIPTAPTGNVPSIAELQRINNETQNVTRTEIPANLRVETGGVRMETGGQAVQMLPNMPTGNVPSIAELQRINNETRESTFSEDVSRSLEVAKSATLDMFRNVAEFAIDPTSALTGQPKSEAAVRQENIPAAAEIPAPVVPTPAVNVESPRISTLSGQAAATPTAPVNFGQSDFSQIQMPEMNISEKISSAFETAKSAVTSGITAISEMFSEGGASVSESASTSFTQLETTVDTSLANVNTSAETNISQLTANLNTGFGSMNTVAMTNMSMMSTNFTTGFEMINANAAMSMSTLSTTVSTNSASAHASISTEFSGAAADVQGIWSAIPGFFSGIFGGLGGIASAAGSAIASGINSGIGMIQGAWEALSGWLSSKIASLSAMASSAAAAIGIGGNYMGTSSWRGGFTEVNEHGGELIVLPNSEKIYPQATTNNILGDVAHNYNGTSFFKGGWSETNGTGSELMYLPRGTKIINHSTTVSILRKQIRDKLKETGYDNEISAQRTNTNLTNTLTIDDVLADRKILRETQTDALGNLTGVEIPEYNRITSEDSLIVRRAKQEAQRNSLNVARSYASFSAGNSYSEKISSAREDALGNIVGLEIPEYNRITSEDSLMVKRAKQEAQRRSYLQILRENDSKRAEMTKNLVDSQPFGTENAPEIAHNYSGTSYFGGGLSTVNEHGGEIINLSNGTTIYPQATAKNVLQRELQRRPKIDSLGNIQGLDVPEYNRITGDDSLVVRRAKYQAQLEQLRSRQQTERFYGDISKTSRDTLESRVATSQALTDIRRQAITKENSQHDLHSLSAANAQEITNKNAVKPAKSNAPVFKTAISGTTNNPAAKAQPAKRRKNFIEKGAEAVTSFFNNIFRQSKSRGKGASASTTNISDSSIWSGTTTFPSSTTNISDSSIWSGTTTFPSSTTSGQTTFPDVSPSVRSNARSRINNRTLQRMNRALEIRSRVERDVQALSQITGKPTYLPASTESFSTTSTASSFEDIFNQPANSATAVSNTSTFTLNDASGTASTGSLANLTRASSTTALSDTSNIFSSSGGISNTSRTQAANSSTNKFNAWTLVSALLSAQRNNYNNRNRSSSHGGNFMKALLGIGFIGALGKTIFGGRKSAQNQSSATSISDTSLFPFTSEVNSTSTLNNSFVSTKPKSDIRGDIVNIWRQSRKKNGLLSMDNIWKPTLSYSDISNQTGGGTSNFAQMFSQGDMLGNQLATGGLPMPNQSLEFGELPVPAFDFPKMVKDTASGGGSSSTTNNSSSSSTNNFNFGDVNISNNLDFEDFMNRLRTLIKQSTSNHG